MTEEITPRQEPGYCPSHDLVSDAFGEYYYKQDQVISDLELRALDLFARVAPGHRDCAEVYSHGEDCIMCDVEDVVDGFGILSLSFHKGAIPEADYFVVANYMELASPVRIYTLYDLGRVLSEITDMAQEVLRTFRQSVIDGSPCSWAPKPE